MTLVNNNSSVYSITFNDFSAITDDRFGDNDKSGPTLLSINKVTNSSSTIKSRHDFFPESLLELKSPSLVMKVMAGLKGNTPKGDKAIPEKQDLNEVKNKYEQFTLDATRSIMQLEKQVASKKEPNASVIDMATSIEKDIVDKLNAFKSSIVYGSHLDGKGKAWLNARENTADALTKNILFQVKEIKSSLK